MQEAHDLLQHPPRVAGGDRLLLFVLAVEAHLHELEVPVAELVPDEVIEHIHGGGEVVDGHRRLHLGQADRKSVV
jgi:hypothetical protein